MVQPTRKIPTLTTAAVARRIGVSGEVVRQWTNDGLLRCFRLPGSGFRRFYEDDVERFIAEHTSEAS